MIRASAVWAAAGAMGVFLSSAVHVETGAAGRKGVDLGKLETSLAQHVDRIHERLGFSGAVLVARNGQVVTTIARGFSDPQAKTELRPESLFEIASVTKSVTAIATIRLVEQGKLKLDDSISEHLPNIPDQCEPITIRHLLSHTSGIPGSNTRGNGDDISKVIPTFLAGGPQHPPGTHHEYWNQGYALLSEIIASTTGQPYTKAVETLVFSPCKMDLSLFTGDAPPPNTDVTMGRDTLGRSRSALSHPYGSYGFQYRGMGGMVTNIQDMWKLDRALATKELLKESSITEMTTAKVANYALGFRTGTAPDGSSFHHHSGSVRGFLADFRRYPGIDGAIIVLCNSNNSLAFGLLTQGLETILFGADGGVSIPLRPSDDWLTNASGEYFDQKRRRLVIANADGLPSIRIYWGGPVTHGHLGLAKDGKPHLYMISSKRGRTQLIDDGPITVSPTDQRSKTVSLESLKPPLVFSR